MSKNTKLLRRYFAGFCLLRVAFLHKSILLTSNFVIGFRFLSDSSAILQ